MKKNLVIQYYIDVKKYSQPGFNNLKPSPMETYSRNSFQKYCEKFNLDYLRITEPKLAFKHPTWERFDLWVDRSWYDRYEQILSAESTWIVLYKNSPFNLKSGNYHSSTPGPKYKKTSFCNPGHAHNLAERLNAQFNCNDFTVINIK